MHAGCSEAHIESKQQKENKKAQLELQRKAKVRWTQNVCNGILENVDGQSSSFPHSFIFISSENYTKLNRKLFPFLSLSNRSGHFSCHWVHLICIRVNKNLNSVFCECHDFRSTCTFHPRNKLKDILKILAINSNQYPLSLCKW